MHRQVLMVFPSNDIAVINTCIVMSHYAYCTRHPVSHTNVSLLRTTTKEARQYQCSKNTGTTKQKRTGRTTTLNARPNANGETNKQN